MRLEKKRIRILIILTTVALAGLLILQVYLLKQAYNLKMQAFHQNIQSALNDIVSKVETREAAARIIAISVTDSVSLPLLNKRIQIFQKNVPPGSAKVICIDSPQINVQVIDTMIRFFERTPGKQKKSNDSFKTSNTTSGFSYQMSTDSTKFNVEVGIPEGYTQFTHVTVSDKKKLIVEKVMQDLNNISTMVSIDKRIKGLNLDSLVTRSLHEKGITIPCVWGIVYEKNDSLIITNSDNFNEKLISSKFKSRLFPNDLFAQPNFLKIYFPDQTYYLFRQSSFPIFASMLFIFIIIFSFYYTVDAIRKQKRFSQTLAAFINNMTHEFKTPISTISLASDTLIDPVVMEDKERLVKYGSIIHDESRRMREQVEKILQMAEVEEGSVILKKTDVNVHKLLEEAAKNMALIVEKRGGSIKLDLHAASSIISGDKLHLQNIIHNIMDNAIKYTEGKPEIIILTSNEDEKLLIEIEDNGIGMKIEEQKRVFEKYYRVPTGNIHNVKGFGLGLSYVDLMTKAHGGSVSLKSYFQKGTKVRLLFPLSEERGA